MEICRFCGDPIILGPFKTWHHASDDAIVCAIGLDTESPGEIVLHYASPDPRPEP